MSTDAMVSIVTSTGYLNGKNVYLIEQPAHVRANVLKPI